ncbi:MAG: hypothetical protein LBU68_00690 [Rickettsiales bacterium]|jgi:hypothetical protein|nr:hypothetical protein [Rickettsiales bacterium]
MVRQLDKYEIYDLQLRMIAEHRCKSQNEWREDETSRRQGKLHESKMRYKSVEELFERNQMRAYRAQKAELWYEEKIKNCDERIKFLQEKIANPAYLKKDGIKLRNQLVYAKGCLIDFELCLIRHHSKTEFYEYLCAKWCGILEKIHIAEIAREIRAERKGYYNQRKNHVNKYGFNPLAKSRETAEIVFED